MMHRKRSRSPRFRSPNRQRGDRVEECFSISSLSDCSIGHARDNDPGKSRKSKDRHKRHSRHFDKNYDDREDKKGSRDFQNVIQIPNDLYQSEYQNNNRHDMEQPLDPSICNFGESMSHNEPSYIQQKIVSPDSDRLGRLEKMVEMLVQTNVNKPQAGTFIPPQEIQLTSSDPRFKGNTSVWLNQINEECLERHFDEITCINFTLSKMTGLMKAWYKTLDPYEYSWPELKMLITQTFPDTVDFANTLHLLVDRIKRPDETITQYYFSKMFLIEACKISGPNAVSCLIDGLNDPHVQKEAKEQGFLTPEKLYAQYLIKLPNFGLGSQVVEQEPMIEVVRDHGMRDSEDYHHPRNDHKKREKEGKRKCFTCGKMGHISQHCRHAPICYKCGDKGHIAAKCKIL